MNKPSLGVEAGIDAVIARQMTSSIIISVAIACLIVAALWDSLNTDSLLYWLGTLSTISALRIAMGYFAIVSPERKKQTQLTLTMAAGLIWGMSAPLFLPYLDVHHQMLLILVLIGLGAGSSNSYAGRMQLFYAFMLPILIILAIWFFAQGGHTYITLGIIDLAYMLALSVFAQRNTLLLKNSLMKNELFAGELKLRGIHEQRMELQQRILDAIARHRGSLSEILTTIVQQVQDQRLGMIASILLLDNAGKHLLAGAAPGLPDAWNAAIDGAEIGPATGSCGTAAFRNERVIVADIATDPLWAAYREAALAFDLKACWSEPIHDAGGNVLGTFAMYYHTISHPSDEDLQLIEQIASLTSIAIGNSRNREQLEIARQQHAELMDTVKQSSDMIYVYGLDGVISAANEAANATFGGEIIGKNIADIVAPEQMQHARDMIQEKLATGKSTVYELDVIDLHGQRHNLEINSSLVMCDGKPVAINGIARDITKRKKTEKQLALLIQAINASHESIMVLDAEGIIEFANPSAAALYQKPVAQIIGMPAAVLRGGNTGDATYNDIIFTIKHGKIWIGELLFHAGDNDDRLVARRISPIMDENGKVHHQICIDRDITEAKQRSLQLEHTQRLESLGILAGGIAHDFNNLLTAIMGNAAMAERGMDTNRNIRMHLSHITKTSQRAAELCKQMLAYSGKGRFVITPINIPELIREMTRLMEVSIGKQITIRYALNEDLPLVDADSAQIQQVILNLITNANESIGDSSGEIAFSTGVMQAGQAYLNASLTNEKLPKGEYIYIEVADSGCGMDRATMQKMFDPFFTTKFTGRGLGMSAVLGIVRGHHGAIRVKSQPKKGTTFRILLPASDSNSVARDTEAIKPVSTNQTKGTILIVDDEMLIREIANAILTDIGFDILEAVDGKEAVELYRQHQPTISAVLLDMTMPQMDGKTCFSELKKINPDVQVLLSSGYSEQDINKLFAGHAPAGFIQKPYMPEALQQKMVEILS